MFGIKRCYECKEKTEEEKFNVYKAKREIDRVKLHAKYISCISVGIVIWLIATGNAENPEFSGWISFASTVTSIILSVIAIILSITGESKTEAIKNDLSETARKIDEVADKMNVEMLEANQGIKELITQLDEKIKNLQIQVDKVPENVAEKVTNTYSKTNNNATKNTRREINNKKEWGRRDAES